MDILRIEKLLKTYDEKSLTTVNQVSFSLKKGEILSIIGPSGTGKSTLVKMIAGIISPKSGKMFFYDEELPYTKEHEKIAYVPQELSLDNEKNIFDNIKTKVAHLNEDEIHVKVRDMIEVFGLQYKDFKSPTELSTGQKQRAEMAKALVNSPEVLILDEPFSNLDKSLREQLKSELFEILEERQISCIMVTHDLDDAFSGSDRVMVMADGIVKQLATPREIYQRPACSYVARFSGAVNLLAGPITPLENGLFHIKNSFGEFEVKAYQEALLQAKFAYLVIRPEMTELNAKGKYKGKVLNKRFYGPYIDLWLKTVDQNKFIIRVPYDQEQEIGKTIRFDIKTKDLYLLMI